MLNLNKIYKIFIILILLCSSTFANGFEKQKVDKKYDTIKVLKKLTWEYRAKDPKLALKYGYKALELITEYQLLRELPELYNYIGVVYMGLVRNSIAAKYFVMARDKADYFNDSIQLGYAFNNLGANFYYINEFQKSLENLNEALKIFSKINFQTGMSYVYNSLVLTHLKLANYNKAKYFNNLMYNIRKVEKDSIGIAKAFLNSARIYLNEKKYDSAFVYLKLSEQTAGNLEKNLGFAVAFYMHYGDYFNELNNFNKALIYYKKALNISYKIAFWDDFSNISMKLMHLYEKNKMYDSALVYSKKFTLGTDSLDARANLVGVFNVLDEFEKEKQRRIENLEREREKLIKYFLISLLVIFGLVVVYILHKNKIIQKKNKELEEKNELIERKNSIINQEKQRADNLLNSVFPLVIADELRKKEYIEPKIYENVSIMFIDFVGFTNIASKLSPKTLVEELSRIYSVFDQIILKHNCVKVKAIGDSYMIGAGFPYECDDHAERLVKVALEIFEYLKINNKEAQIKWEVRSGLHSGVISAGIIGKTQLTYDIWGDTVNVASRLENSSLPFKINVSEATKKILENKYNFDDRGEISVKGKGKLKMFFLETENISS
jgi:class 3 adenylate cyclase